ncbi:hypothetical protein DMENIID0001_089800 [Sergentomyia squamirostris]
MWALKAIAVVAFITLVSGAGPVRPGLGNPSPRLPRTSASQLLHANSTGFKAPPSAKNTTNHGRPSLRTRVLFTCRNLSIEHNLLTQYKFNRFDCLNGLLVNG